MIFWYRSSIAPYNYIMFILLERKQKKFKSSLHTIRVKTILEVNFLPLIRCCIVIDQIAQLCATTNSGYLWYCTCDSAPGLDHHEGGLRKALWQPRSAMPLNRDRSPEALAAGCSAVPTKVSPKCRLVTLMHDERHWQFDKATSLVRETEQDRSFHDPEQFT